MQRPDSEPGTPRKRGFATGSTRRARCLRIGPRIAARPGLRVRTDVCVGSARVSLGDVEDPASRMCSSRGFAIGGAIQGSPLPSLPVCAVPGGRSASRPFSADESVTSPTVSGRGTSCPSMGFVPLQGSTCSAVRAPPYYRLSRLDSVVGRPEGNPRRPPSAGQDLAGPACRAIPRRFAGQLPALPCGVALDAVRSFPPFASRRRTGRSDRVCRVCPGQELRVRLRRRTSDDPCGPPSRGGERVTRRPSWGFSRSKSAPRIKKRERRILKTRCHSVGRGKPGATSPVRAEVSGGGETNLR
jgi:hypothetical protein